MTLPRLLILLLVLVVLLVWNGMGHAQALSVADGAHARLRADASAGGTILAVLPPGTPVKLLEEKGDYVRVGAGRKKGWVAKRLLVTKSPPSWAVLESSSPRSVASRHAAAGEIQVRRDELALMREEQEKNTWRMIGTTAGVALAFLIAGFWLRGVIFQAMQRPAEKGSACRKD